MVGDIPYWGPGRAYIRVHDMASYPDDIDNTWEERIIHRGWVKNERITVDCSGPND